jgi:hypothetical protein
MVREKAVEKIQKLLALSECKAASPAEAANAAAQAQKLINQHRISEAELLEAGTIVDDEKIEYFKEDPIFCAGRISTWQLELASAIASANYCRTITRPGMKGFKNSAAILLVGRKTDKEIVEYLFHYCKNTIEALCKAYMLMGHGSGKRFSNSFKIGAARGIRDKLAEAKKVEKEYFAESPQSGALVLLRKREEDLRKFVNEKFPGTYSYSYKYSKKGMSQGYEAGKKININPGLGGGKGTKLLGG